MKNKKENQTNEKKICIVSDNLYRYDLMFVWNTQVYKNKGKTYIGIVALLVMST